MKNVSKNRNNAKIIDCLKITNDSLAWLNSTAKQNYYTRTTKKLESAQKSSEANWFLLKNFLNDKKKKIIPPL